MTSRLTKKEIYSAWQEFKTGLDENISSFTDQVEQAYADSQSYTCVYCGLKRYHLPGAHDQCDHSVTGGCVDKEWEEQESKIKDLDSKMDTIRAELKDLVGIEPRLELQNKL